MLLKRTRATELQPSGSRGWAYLAGFLTLAGLVHFVAPHVYRPLIPDRLGAADPWVYGSGAAELAVGAALVPRRTRRPAAIAAAVLFVVVFPSNMQMAWNARGGTLVRQLATLARLPVQGLLIWWALRVANRAEVVDPAPNAVP